MSILSSNRFGVAAGTLVAIFTFVLRPVDTSANTCELLGNSFRCMTGQVKKAPRKKRIRVAAIRPTATISDADPVIVHPVRRPVKKASHKVRKNSKSGSSHRRKYLRRLKRKSSRTARRRGRVATIGSRYNAKSVRKTSRRSLRASKHTNRHAKKAQKAKRVQRGWRTRSKGFGYRAANRSISTGCFPSRLRGLLRKVSAHYGRRLVITSGYRSPRHNRRIGGAKRSQHMHCKAADFYVPGVNKFSLARYLKAMPGRGGVGTYCGNRTVHLDVGPRRTWHWGCRRSHGRHYARRHKGIRHRSSRKRGRRKVARRRAIRFRGAKI